MIEIDRTSNIEHFTKIHSMKSTTFYIVCFISMLLVPNLWAASPQAPDSTEPSGQKFSEAPSKKILRVLLLGAGSSHDFPRYFLGTDSETLKATGTMDVAATPNLQEALTLLPQAEVLVFSGNDDQYGTEDFQSALHRFADSGKGIILLHAATWSHPWKGYNDRFVAGRTPSHGKGEFSVRITDTKHPLTYGVDTDFKIIDENYRVEISDPSRIHLCAENAPDGRPTPNPCVWTVNDPKARIVCITLGHAAEAHQLPEFKNLLINAVNWVAKR